MRHGWAKLAAMAGLAAAAGIGCTVHEERPRRRVVVVAATPPPPPGPVVVYTDPAPPPPIEVVPVSPGPEFIYVRGGYSRDPYGHWLWRRGAYRRRY